LRTEKENVPSALASDSCAVVAWPSTTVRRCGGREAGSTGYTSTATFGPNTVPRRVTAAISVGGSGAVTMTSVLSATACVRSWSSMFARGREGLCITWARASRNPSSDTPTGRLVPAARRSA